MANGLPTFCCVASANLRAPLELKRKLTTGSLVRWSKPGWASTRSPPDTSTRFSIRYFSPPWPLRISESGGGRVSTACCGRSEEHTSELQSHVNLVCRLLLEKKKYY